MARTVRSGVDAPRIEGYWRNGDEPQLPMPVPDVDWPGRTEFLSRLGAMEARSRTTHYKGWSNCRLCGKMNGSKEYSLGQWSWPEGLAHYLRDHGVRPTPDFEAFVLAQEG